jgi:tetratricopeptide (TPR) repeat protein
MTTADHSLELCAPPPLDAACPPTVERLEELLEQDPENIAVYFTLGNLLFRRGQTYDAISQYQRALQIMPDNAGITCNLGVAAFRQQDYDSAVASFKKALMLDSQLAVAQLYLGRINLLQADYSRAESAYLAALELGLNRPEVHYSLGLVLDQRGEPEKAVEKFKVAYDLDSNYAPARNRLCFLEFDKGREVLRQGKLAEAFEIWWEADRLYSPAFTVDQHLAAQLRQIVEDYNESGALKTRIDGYSEQIHKGQDAALIAYELISEFLFSLGLMPECYEAKDSLSLRLQYWKGSLEVSGEHPYPHYRIALILAHQGKYDAALSELRICFDKLPVKKHAALKLRAILRFVTNIRDIKPLQSRLKESGASSKDWAETGFKSEFEIEAWKKTGTEPKQALKWREAGFSARQTIQWREYDFELLEAKQWSESAFKDPGEASRWLRGGFDPVEASRWREGFSAKIEEVLQWHRAGFSDPEDAKRWVALFTFPWEAIQWRELGMSVEEAERWIDGGFTDPYVVKRLQRKPQQSAEVAVSEQVSELLEEEDLAEDSQGEE